MIIKQAGREEDCDDQGERNWLLSVLSVLLTIRTINTMNSICAKTFILYFRKNRQKLIGIQAPLDLGEWLPSCLRILYYAMPIKNISEHCVTPRLVSVKLETYKWPQIAVKTEMLMITMMSNGSVIIPNNNSCFETLHTLWPRSIA